MNLPTIITMWVVNFIDPLKNTMIISSKEILEEVSTTSLSDLTANEPSKSLYVAVIMRAILDASKPKKKNESSEIKTYREDANNWLFKEIGATSKDFVLICDLAGLPFNRVRTLAHNVINSGDENERDKLYRFL